MAEKLTACLKCQHYAGPDGMYHIPLCKTGDYCFNPLTGRYERSHVEAAKKNYDGYCPDFEPKRRWLKWRR